MRAIKFYLGCLLVGLLLFANVYATTTYTVKRGDTLWGIAKHHRPSRSVSIDNMIKAIRMLNPTIFSAGSNALSIGVQLTLPSTNKEVAKALGKPVVASAPSKSYSEKSTSQQPAKKPKSTGNGLPFQEHPQQTQVQILQNNVMELRQVATMAQKSVTELQRKNSNLTQQLQQKQQAVTALQSKLSTAQGQGRFPWAWLWFVLFIIVLAVFWYQQRKSQQGTGRGEAASRFGLKSDRKKMNMSDYASLNEQVNRYEVEAGEVVKPRVDLGESNQLLMQVESDISQGNYAFAEKKLKHAIWEDKKNIVLRMKLLEVYSLMGNKREFNKVSEYMLKHLVSEDSDEWAQVRKLYLNTWVYD